MTRRHSQKRLIRERMASAGLSYSTARSQLLARSSATVVERPVVMIPVRNMERAIDFYGRALGIGLDWGDGDGSWAELSAGGIRIALTLADSGGGATGLGLLVGDLETVGETVVEMGGTVAQHGPVVVVTDPDGNTVKLMALA